MPYYSLFSIQFLLFFFLFLFGVFVSFYLPGRFVIKRIGKFSPTLFVLLSLVTGLVMWGFQGYIFGYLQVRILTYFYLLFFIVSFVASQRMKRIKIKFDLNKLIKKNLLLISLILIGLVLQLIPVIGSGLKYSDGIRFYGVNGTDGIMHLAYIGGIIRHMPPLEPGAFPSQITNYHYWSDMIIADFARIWKIPVTHLFFQYFPFLISILSGLAAYKVIREIGGNKTAGLWSVFFLYFGGDATYLLLMIFKHVVSFAGPAIDNGAVQFLNMPNAMAKLVFLVSIILLKRWLTDRKLILGILCMFFMASLFGLKIYYGIFVALGLLLVIVGLPLATIIIKRNSSLLNEIKKQFSSLLLLLLFIVISLVIYLPANSGSGGLAYYPLEWPKIFIGPEVLNWGDWWLRMQVYELHSNYKYIAIYTGLAVIISLICIHGTRLLGVILTKKSLRLLGLPLFLFFVPGVIVFNILGLTTLQQTGGLNVFNFFVVGTVVLSLFLSLTLSNFYFSKNIFKNILIIALIIITIPRVIDEANHYIDKYMHPTGKYDLISNQEMDALNAIRLHTAPDSVIQSHPANQFDKRTPYISALSERFTFLSGVSLQETHNHKLAVRQQELKQIFEADIPSELAKRGRVKRINYFYLHKHTDEKLLFNLDPNILRKFFENDIILIVEIIPEKKT